MKTTNQQLLSTNNLIVSFCNAHERTPATSRLLNRVIPCFEKPLSAMKKTEDDFRNYHCILGEKGEVLSDEKGMRLHTPQHLAEIAEFISEKLLPAEVEIEIDKISWASFNEKEKEWFNLTNKLTYDNLSLCINGLPDFVSDIEQ